jgi:chromosome partitioning protein
VHVLSVSSLKGGVGKTTVTLGLASAAFARGIRTLVVDLDPQSDVSTGLDVSTAGRLNVADVLENPKEKTVRQAIASSGWTKVHPGKIDIMLGSPSAINYDGPHPSVRDVWKMEEALALVEDEYDLVLIDCQPSLGLLTVNALTASHGVLIPLACEYFALRGVALLVETVDKVRDRLNPALELDGILATMYDPRTLHAREVLERVVDTFGDKVFDTVIGRTVKLPDAQIAAKPILDYAPSNAASEAYLQLARELIERKLVA